MRYQLTQTRYYDRLIKVVASMIVIAWKNFIPCACMAVRFAFVSADTDAIPADTNAIRRML